MNNEELEKSCKYIIMFIFGVIISFSLIDISFTLNDIANELKKPSYVSVSCDTIIHQDSDTISQPAFLNKTPEEGLSEALDYYGVHHPDIVYAQSILETGNFTSNLCKNHNNLFGLYDSKNKRYYQFNHWSESVQAYKNKVQYKYDSNKHPTYYAFLSDIGYAEGKDYNKRVKALVAQNKK